MTTASTVRKPTESTVPVRDLPDLPPFRAIPDMLRDNARRAPDSVAIKDGARVATWGAYDRRVSRVARAFARDGIGRGDKVAVLASNSIEYLEIFMGALRAGACVVPLSTMAAADALEMMVSDSESKMLFLSAQYLDMAAQTEGKLPTVREGGRIAVDFARPGWRGFEDWLAGVSDDDFAFDLLPDDDFNIIYSSGTTGLPKGILHAHRMRSMLPVRFADYDFDASTISLVSTPMYSNTTLAALLPTLALGGAAVLMRKFDVVGFLELAEAEKVTHAMLVPVQYQRLLAHPDFDRYDLSSFKMKLCTSAPLRAATKTDILKRWPGRMIEIYGLTEGGGSCALELNAFPHKAHTVGRPGVGVELKFIDEAGKELAVGEVGEIVGRAGLMMKGYYKQPAKTRELFWYDERGELYFRSGDMGRMDEDGFVVLLDRRKDMIISGGFNVYPVDIEAELMRHPAVADAAVIGVPSEQWGETPLALAVLRPGASATADELRDWLNAKMSKTQRVSGVELRDQLPRSTIGKVMKRELREPYWAGRGSKI